MVIATTKWWRNKPLNSLGNLRGPQNMSKIKALPAPDCHKTVAKDSHTNSLDVVLYTNGNEANHPSRTLCPLRQL
jgi:hypothetical protein